jgi:prepilin-type N-terminal cleavage/methylation domain-containing protein
MAKMRVYTRRKRAFTLVELLVVIAIIALLLSIMMPALSKAREQAKKTICMANFKQLGLGLLTYSSDYNGRWPSKFMVPSTDPVSSRNGTPIKYYSTWQLWLDTPGNSNDWQSRMRPAFLDLLTPTYISNYKVYFCPTSSHSQYFKSPKDLWNYTQRNIIIGQWSYQSVNIAWSLKGQSLDPDRYAFQSLWAAGTAGQKALAPLFSDLYYVYASGTAKGKPVSDYTWHKDGESMIFNDGHVEFIKTNSEWFAPVQYAR